MKRVSDILHPLRDRPSQAYLSNTVQLADVLQWILEQVGEAEVWQTSFSISEEFIRRLYFIMKSNKVKSFTLVLDFKATNKTLKLWPFITQVIDKAYLADNHSKILLVKPVTGAPVAVITSQNLTRGNRYESAVVTTDSEVFATLYNSIENLISYHSIPLHDLYERRIKAD